MPEAALEPLPAACAPGRVKLRGNAGHHPRSAGVSPLYLGLPDNANTFRHLKGRARRRSCPGPSSSLLGAGDRGQTEAAPRGPAGRPADFSRGQEEAGSSKAAFQKKAGEAERSKGQGRQRA
ncbi:unnamed protein product [Rangifer tarandus platyrhynchus]|uniref:Uncharacterized protein n=2 Tax=Rangifer tarandus platyrhynchus TaxID=3082113 RepID=A0ACB0F5G7_RANTA|nr:unnamed protein product [Rangifer tarandus platyrhynchus]CAI9708280.1 unnamed protein product [Rangifer tarandus platyrhynchus]